MQKKNYYQRKIQKFAKYSYAVTLPVDWVKKSGLERIKGSLNSGTNNSISEEVDPMVTMYEMADGSLQIYPFTRSHEKEPQIFRLEYEELIKSNPKFIKDNGISLLLISFYMNGAAGVEIISKKAIPKELIDQMEKISTRLLFNWNLTRESNHRVLIKNVFHESPETIIEEEIPRYLRESFSIILWMLEDIQTAIEENKYGHLTELIKEDEKIDRYYFFIVREIRTIFEHPKLSKPIKYSHKKLIDLRLLSKLIEDVGDSLKDCAIVFAEHHEFIISLNLRPYLLEYFSVLYKAYSKLADHLRKSVGNPTHVASFNQEIMKTIRFYRMEGSKLKEKWLEIAPKLQISTNHNTFLDFYQGSRLLRNLEDIYKKIFDFTNIFF